MAKHPPLGMSLREMAKSSSCPCVGGHDIHVDRVRAEDVHCNFLAPDVYGEDCTPSESVPTVIS